MKKLLLICLIFILLINSVSAVCTLTLDKETYSLGETATVTANCDAVNEKNTAYTITWANASGTVLEIDTGTTPTVQGTNFFETFLINDTYITNWGITLNATMTGNNLEGEDSATIQAAQNIDLIIENVQFSSQRFLGSVVGIEFDVKDSNDKKVTGAECEVHIDDTDNLPVVVSSRTFFSHGGEASFSQYISALEFQEGTSYLATIHCSCGANNTEKQCFNEDEDILVNKIGTATGPFTTSTWLTVNTLTNNVNFVGREEMMICANLTNVEYDKRIPVEIYHQVRCSNGADNDNDKDRALIFSDDGQPDERGISVGGVQTQCKRFVIPEPSYLQGRSNECYASTSVWVLDDNRRKIKSYVTSSPVFNITIDDLNIDGDWQRTEEHVFNTIINLSDEKYSMWNGIGNGNMDIRLNKYYTESIRAEDQHVEYPLQFRSFIDIDHIDNVTVYNKSGDMLNWIIEFLDDGNIEIEVRDTDISPTGYVNLTMTIKNLEERTTEALEGIEDSAGTFDFTIFVPNTEEETVIMRGNGLTGKGNVLNRDIFVKCGVIGYPETNKEFPVFATDTFAFTVEMDVPENSGLYTMSCIVIDRFFGEDATPARDNFEVLGVVDPVNPINPASPIIQDEDIIGDNETFIEEVVEKLKSMDDKLGNFLKNVFNINSGLAIGLMVFILMALVISMTLAVGYKKREKNNGKDKKETPDIFT